MSNSFAAANCAFTGWAAGSPGWMPAPAAACMRLPRTCKPSKNGKASKLVAPKKHRSARASSALQPWKDSPPNCRSASTAPISRTSLPRPNVSSKAVDLMIILLGASGYIGQAFARILKERGETFVAPARKDLDYTRFDVLLELLRQKN